jgi:hypothetical protein
VIQYTRLSEMLVSGGFVENAVDHCVFTKTDADGVRCQICVNADDILVIDSRAYMTEEEEPDN